MTPTEFRAARKRLGLTQTALAAALGLGRTSICMYEAGKAPIPRTAELAIMSLEHMAKYPKIRAALRDN